MEEIWLDIQGYEGLYKVSNLGNVRSLERTEINKHGLPIRIKERILKPGKNDDGYFYVVLTKNSKRSSKRVNRLVAQCFIANPESKRIVNHIDGVKTNNTAENLEWTTSSENNKHAYDFGLNRASNPNKNGKMCGEKQGLSKLKEDDVRYIRANCKKNGGVFKIVELANKFNVTTCVISYVVHRKTWKHVI